MSWLVQSQRAARGFIVQDSVHRGIAKNLAAPELGLKRWGGGCFEAMATPKTSLRKVDKHLS